MLLQDAASKLHINVKFLNAKRRSGLVPAPEWPETTNAGGVAYWHGRKMGWCRAARQGVMCYWGLMGPTLTLTPAAATVAMQKCYGSLSWM